jgi:hypothetical protein
MSVLIAILVPILVLKPALDSGPPKARPLRTRRKVNKNMWIWVFERLCQDNATDLTSKCYGVDMSKLHQHRLYCCAKAKESRAFNHVLNFRNKIGSNGKTGQA